MSGQYKIHNPDGLYFITITTVGWVDVFIRNVYRDSIIDSLKYCQTNKGLNLHAYVIMTSHLHLIVSSQPNHDLTSTIRDFKKHTSKDLIKLIKEIPESRSEWMLSKFAYEANRTKRGTNFTFWQTGYHAKELISNDFIVQKLDYIHNNPVDAGFVSRPEYFVYSSAGNYAGEIGLIEISYLD